MYEIIYDYDDGWCGVSTNIRETFEGSWSELQEYIKELKRDGCYNISAASISED